ncbi:MAG: endonuclease, partial [Pedobacter sp.]
MKTLTSFLICLLLSAAVFAQKKETPINIITYNIRYNNPGDGVNAWPNRKDNVKALVKFHDADILCV